MEPTKMTVETIPRDLQKLIGVQPYIRGRIAGKIGMFGKGDDKESQMEMYLAFLAMKDKEQSEELLRALNEYDAGKDVTMMEYVEQEPAKVPTAPSAPKMAEEKKEEPAKEPQKKPTQSDEQKPAKTRTKRGKANGKSAEPVDLSPPKLPPGFPTSLPEGPADRPKKSSPTPGVSPSMISDLVEEVRRCNERVEELSAKTEEIKSVAGSSMALLMWTYLSLFSNNEKVSVSYLVECIKGVIGRGELEAFIEGTRNHKPSGK